MEIILGNIFSGCALLSDTYSATKKTHKSMILIQTASLIFYALSSIMLKGYSALVQNFVSIFRNLFSLRGNISKVMEWFLVIVGVVLGIYFNNLKIIGLFPVAANLEYSIAVFRFKDNVTALKIAFILNAVLFAVFNAYIMNIVGLIGNIVLIITTTVSMVKDGKAKNETGDLSQSEETEKASAEAETECIDKE